ncbi:hypothetical protein HPC37_04385 [Pasteurellaceae bacterium 20609_3]|uniref:hypothetical protein n=1 Tax=Spirabiliibacterium mucosae TaxID=28156 RepID=UPI001AAC93DE|nr:hypothetical protein [Spirabiliibacterium mucosae]MBE2898080.1 hypothetical protein [Spirabiliibacterium mucosae]
MDINNFIVSTNNRSILTALLAVLTKEQREVLGKSLENVMGGINERCKELEFKDSSGLAKKLQDDMNDFISVIKQSCDIK